MASLLFDPTGVFLREITAFGERFTDSMALRSEEETIAEISLSDYLARYGERIDYHCGKEVIIPIHIDVTSSEITVTVSDWDEGKVQIPEGKVADDKMLNTMNYFVKGVIGKVPTGK